MLSAPEVMVLDNEPARLRSATCADADPDATSTLTSGAPIVNSIDYHDTGVIMQVTPRVNSGGLVTLDLPRKSATSLTPRPTGPSSPTFDQHLFRTRVAIQDGQTVGLAGLIRDNVTEGNSGIPFLKDIPLLGTLFSTQANRRSAPNCWC